MRAAVVSEFGGPEVLKAAEWPDPRAGPGEVVVRIRAANVNPTDLGVRSGAARRRMPELTPPFVPGWDLAGEVIEVGAGAGDRRTGERVVGMIPFGRIGGRVGAYAEAAAVDAAWLEALPDGIDDVVAATLPLNALTAHQALDLLAAPPGSTLLVTGASGAVGGFATQLAARAGHRVLATASEGDEEWVAGLGAAGVVPRSADLQRVGPVDAVLDAVPLGPRSAAALGDGGTVVFTRPPDPPQPPPGVRFETVWVMPDPPALRALVADLAAGRLRTRVAGTVALERAAEAHARVEAGGVRGKIVLTP